MALVAVVVEAEIRAAFAVRGDACGSLRAELKAVHVLDGAAQVEALQEIVSITFETESKRIVVNWISRDDGERFAYFIPFAGGYGGVALHNPYPCAERVVAHGQVAFDNTRRRRSNIICRCRSHVGPCHLFAADGAHRAVVQYALAFGERNVVMRPLKYRTRVVIIVI